LQLSEFALMNPLDSLDEIRDASPLRTGLEYPFGLVDGIGKFLTSFDGNAARFLAVDILASLGCHDRSRRMPTIPGGDQDCVDILAIEKFAKVRVELAILIVIETIDKLFAGISAGCLDIGNSHASHVGKWQHGFEIVSASWSDADDS
jgi:hypothetical protein